MDISSAPALKATNFFCGISPLRPNSTSTIHFVKHPLKKSLDYSILFPRIPSRTPSAIPKRRALRVSAAHFQWRPTRRRNTLREKLVAPQEYQVRNSPEFPILDSTLEDSCVAHGDGKNTELSLDLDTGRERVEKISSEELSRDRNGNSMLWDRLENWVDQYKRDSEFWGVGSAPIFTIYKDFSGSISRVEVNEEEISKRSQVGAWSPERNEDLEEELMDVSSRISRAKHIAKEIESGEYKIPGGSSIAKFVVEGRKMSLVHGLRSVTLGTRPLWKLFPRIGLMVLCASCVFWVATKLFVGNEKVELTREEAKMLRRKKKSRMEREELEKGSIKVLPDVLELPVETGRRPQLDQEKLMESIMQATKMREHSAIPSMSSNYNGHDLDFDAKVREIREMARRARELERQEQSLADEQGEGDDVSAMLLVAKGRKVCSEAGSMKRLFEHANIIDINSLTDKEKENSMDLEDRSMSVERSMDGANNTVNENSLKLSGTNRDDVAINVDDHKMGVRGYSKEAYFRVDEGNSAHTTNANTSSAGVSRNEEKFGDSTAESIISKETEPSESSSDAPSTVSHRAKPKVIISVKEAKKYLAKKRGMPTEAQADKKGLAERSPSNKINQKEIENTETVEHPKPQKLHPVKVKPVASEPYGDKNSASMLKKPLPVNVSQSKLHEDHTTDDEFSMKNSNCKVLGEKSVDSRYDMPDEKSGKPLNVNGVSHPPVLNDLRNGKMVSSSKRLLGGAAETSDPLTKSRTSRVDILEDEDKPTEHCSFHASDNKLALESQDSCSGESSLNDRSDVKNPWMINPSQESTSKKGKTYDDGSPSCPMRADISGDLGLSTLNTALDNSEYGDDMKSLSRSGKSPLQDSDCFESDTKPKPVIAEESWVEKNFQEFDPIIKKIGVGFKDNYKVAKEKTNEMSSLSSEISELGLMEEDEELEWMNDDSLREIVLKVQENELAGRDPFHLMDADDKCAFFQGLEHKAEKVNEKLLGLHEWIHSRIENLDYGADGISLDDPPDKIIPRWKGPVVDKNPEFLKRSTENRETSFCGDKLVSDGAKAASQYRLQISGDLPNNPNDVSPSSVIDRDKISSKGASKSPKTLIECSDGSTKAGKKTGKEHWQHTKKWSQGFLDVYNAETDPEIKSVMKDMGKDLDRWITEKEIQDVADLMTRIPKRKRRYIEKKMDKLKREMELYGAQAVVSKYREYSNDQEEDYLWWLDLRYILCIELYTIEDGNQKVGFYSLEMAADLELDPKQYHIIAFEDPGDAKNFCYIVQSHLEMLGRGSAFVVARPPKDAFREAKANGFHVTVIRKGELKLNIDQTLEEVDEELVEIGSKVYHDKIMRERSVDMSALIKGVFRADKSTKRKSKRMLTKPVKS